jgi:hypothetical protein
MEARGSTRLSASLCRLPGRSSCKNGQTLIAMTDSNGKGRSKGNSVLGHSLEAAADADKKTCQERRDRNGS